jgi:hypothetical protein
LRREIESNSWHVPADVVVRCRLLRRLKVFFGVAGTFNKGSEFRSIIFRSSTEVGQ